jgi:hypothetical protein
VEVDEATPALRGPHSSSVLYQCNEGVIEIFQPLSVLRDFPSHMRSIGRRKTSKHEIMLWSGLLMTVGSNAGCMHIFRCELHVCMLIYWFCPLLELFYSSYEHLSRSQMGVALLLMPCCEFQELRSCFHFKFVHFQRQNCNEY